MKHYKIDKEASFPTNQNITELDSSDIAPESVEVRVTDEVTVFITREFIEFYADYFRLLDGKERTAGEESAFQHFAD